MKQGLLIAFGELFLKSDQVKKLFIERLLNNISFFCQKEKIKFRVFLLRDRIFLETDQGEKVRKIIKHVPGIAWYASSIYFDRFSLKEVVSFISENHGIKTKESFALRVKRKKQTKESKELIIKRIAKEIDRPVNLDNPDKEIFIEIQIKGTFIYFKKKKGRGGLPLNSAGKVLV